VKEAHADQGEQDRRLFADPPLGSTGRCAFTVLNTGLVRATPARADTQGKQGWLGQVVL
jgi:hypothetical protein